MSFSDSGRRLTVVDEPGPHAGLHALDEHAILRADLRIERERLLDPGLVCVLCDEVVEEAVCPLRGRAEPSDRSRSSVARA